MYQAKKITLYWWLTYKIMFSLSKRSDNLASSTEEFVFLLLYYHLTCICKVCLASAFKFIKRISFDAENYHSHLSFLIRSKLETEHLRKIYNSKKKLTPFLTFPLLRKKVVDQHRFWVLKMLTNKTGLPV